MLAFGLEARAGGRRIGFVPTMGALHEGHLSLIRKSVLENDVTVVSIFVNPKQFNNPTDLENYPRFEDRDLELLEGENCDIAFVPAHDEVYPRDLPKPVELGRLGSILEGAFRPGHFDGVTTVVKRLFELVNPDRAYFGQKDYQQLAVIRFMTTTLGLDIDIISCPTSRSPEGLALSSRNLLLSEGEKMNALLFSQCLDLARNNIYSESVDEIKRKVTKAFSEDGLCRLEYFEIADSESLEPVEEAGDGRSLVGLIAGYAGKVRLIDNLILIP